MEMSDGFEKRRVCKAASRRNKRRGMDGGDDRLSNNCVYIFILYFNFINTPSKE